MRRALIAGLVVAGALTAPAGASADWTVGDYRGATSQDYESRMRFMSDHVTRYGFELKMPCTKKRKGRPPARKTSSGRYTSGRKIPLRPDGTFSGTFRDKRFKTSLSGRVDGDEASGTFSIVYKRSDGFTCRSGKLKWRVTSMSRG